MRKLILATLALSPMMLHAQATSPAKTASSNYAPTLEAKLTQPKFSFESNFESNTDPSVSVGTTVRISTGITEPELIHMAPMASPSNSEVYVPGVERTAVVSMVVNEKGIPTDLKIVRSVGPLMDRRVLESVSQYRYKPGTLNHQPTAVPVNLAVVIRSSL